MYRQNKIQVVPIELFENRSNPPSPNPILYLAIYFNIFGYYLPVLPIYLTKNSSGKIIPRTWGQRRKILCGFTSSCVIVGEMTKFLRYLIFKRVAQNNPSSYFDFVENIAGLFEVGFVIITIWFQLKHLDKICKLLQDLRFGLNSIFTSNISKGKIISFTTLVIIMASNSHLTFSLDKFARNDWNVGQTLEIWCDIYFQQFFFDILLPSEWESIMKVAAGVIGFVLVYVGLFVWNFIVWFPFIVTLILYLSFDGFITNVNQREKVDNENTWTNLGEREREEVLHRYKTIQLVSQKINKMFGFAVFALVPTYLPIYIPMLLIVINPPNFLTFLRCGIRFMYLISFFTVVAALNYKNRALKVWLQDLESESKISSRIPIQQLKIYMHQVKHNPIGVNCFKFMQISNSFIASVIISLITFALIRLQFIMMTSNNSNSNSSRMELDGKCIEEIFSYCSSCLNNSTKY